MQHLVALRLAEWALGCEDMTKAALMRMLAGHSINMDEGVVLGAMVLRASLADGGDDSKYELMALAFGGTLVYGWHGAARNIQVRGRAGEGVHVLTERCCICRPNV